MKGLAVKVKDVISLVRNSFHNKAEQNLTKSWWEVKKLEIEAIETWENTSLASDYKKDCIVDFYWLSEIHVIPFMSVSEKSMVVVI